MNLGYINEIGSFLPNEPVPNSEMENRLGEVNGEPSWAKDVVLDSCKITSRHYAIDPETGAPSHTNAQMTAEAVRDAARRVDVDLASLDLLACGTATPDQLNPSHASMTHGELGAGPLEAVSFNGFCASGMAAIRYSAMSVATGMRKTAVATGSEVSSALLRGHRFRVRETDLSIEDFKHNPVLSMNKEFLRWIAADGAGCALISNKPNESRPSLRIDWIDGVSLAHKYDACMYHGADKDRRSGRLKGWMQAPDLAQMVKDNYFCISQDVGLLKKHVISAGVDEVLADIVNRRELRTEQFDWFLPHLSSFFFKQPLADAMDRIGFAFPEEKWFSNLDRVGNLGSAAIYLILREGLDRGLFESGQRILCGVPESGRFTYFYMQLTVC